MNVFIGIAALMTLLVVAWLVYPLLRSKHGSGVSADRLNIDIHRDQLKALEVDLARGVISQQDFDSTRDELQLRLLDDTESYEAPQAHDGQSFLTPRRTALAIALLTPILVLGIYLQLGTPAAINPVAPDSVDQQRINQMVDSLAARLKTKPDDPKGWAMLARSYRILGRLDEAKQAFEKAGSYVHTDPDVLLDYATTLGSLAGNKLEGQSAKLIEEALKLSPENPNALMLSGVSAYQRTDYAGAIKQWEKLLSLIDPASPDVQQIQANIDDARVKGKLPADDATKLPPVPAGVAAGGMTPDMINQMVERLANRLKDNPNDYTGWARLANAYKVQGKLDEAAQAFVKTGPLLDTDANMMSQYADLLATRAKGDFKGQPTTLINKALSIDPKQPNALMMAAQAAYQAGNYAKAIGHWEIVLTVLPNGSTDIDQVKAEIAEAKGKMSGPAKP
ncbi:c-type cytochrome biogenesis protein CcmI [Rhodoferax sp.]|uniref:c-type cytochrome biogenesis protein CcmI n=1 Tax=Rhodoferax sp. TaxID=50421 RepID=UPI00284D57EF|nr:c-type cytochrome biogenesis protein CcmI [Rhodoferax sp.]MDR3369855.1 c-type cytochrome biogenesis protein CcmI [Rhodoferax sp.]